MNTKKALLEEVEMIGIPGGTFMMGSPEEDTDEYPPHLVTLSPFEIGKYPITRGQWQLVMGNNPAYFKGDENLPVETVSWNDAKKFCKKISALTGKAYRLPTEAEWEYVCRAGAKTVATPSLDEGWFYKNSSRCTHPVGQKRPNAFGLYDMHGNVWEWCSDWYGEYESDPQTDPTGPETGRYRVLRGGSWNSNRGVARAVYRSDHVPDLRYFNLGFRVVSCVRPNFFGGDNEKNW